MIFQNTFKNKSDYFFIHSRDIYTTFRYLFISIFFIYFRKKIIYYIIYYIISIVNKKVITFVFKSNFEKINIQIL